MAVDIFENPQIYFLSQTLVRDNELTTVISNQSGHAVRGIAVEFEVMRDGELRKTVVSAGGLPVGGQVQLYPGWYIEDEEKLSKVAVRVVGVRR